MGRTQTRGQAQTVRLTQTSLIPEPTRVRPFRRVSHGSAVNSHAKGWPGTEAQRTL